MARTAPAQFINLDLVLKSRSDLGVIVTHFGARAIVLTHRLYDGEWTLVLELTEGLSQDPGEYTQKFLTVISDFSDAAWDVWRACASRTFSYGFHGGINSAAIDTTISADLLLQIAQVRADVGISVYPYRQP
jgi:hypothetical protein